MNEIEVWYLDQILNPKHPLKKNRLNDLRKLRGSIDLDDPNQDLKLWFCSHLIDNFEDLIVGDILTLKSFADEADLNHFNIFDDDFKKKMAAVFGYENFKKRLGKDLTLKLGVKVCPYCLSQYTLIDTKRDRHIFEYDHFLPQSIYPYLSISLHNMIPSCGNCNRIKKDREDLVPIEYHPLGKSTFHDLYEFKISDKSLVDYYVNGVTNFEVETRTIEPNDPRSIILQNYLDMFAISGLMNRHSDIVHELLIKLEYYSESKKNDLSDLGGSHSFTIHDIGRLLTGYYTVRDDFDKRPLSKFTADIARQIGLI